MQRRAKRSDGQETERRFGYDPPSRWVDRIIEKEVVVEKVVEKIVEKEVLIEKEVVRYNLDFPLHAH